MSVERGRSTGAGRRRARPPGDTRGALPLRATDQVEDLAAWLLTALGLLAVLGAVVVGHAAHRAALAPGRIDDARPVRVQLLADVPQAPTAAQRMPSAASRVPVAWTGADGVEQIGELVLRVPMRVGDEVTAWADRDGGLTVTPPQHASEAVAFGVGAALTTVAGAWALLTLVWAGLRSVTGARNDDAWAREWARVEPTWSRRVR